MVLSSAAESTACPQRLAGTAKQYSKKAMPQLARITSHSGRSVNLRCPYQANVMKTLEHRSSAMGAMDGGSQDIRHSGLMPSFLIRGTAVLSSLSNIAASSSGVLGRAVAVRS